jgi:hypothetical protein
MSSGRAAICPTTSTRVGGDIDGLGERAGHEPLAALRVAVVVGTAGVVPEAAERRRRDLAQRGLGDVGAGERVIDGLGAVYGVGCEIAQLRLAVLDLRGGNRVGRQVGVFYLPVDDVGAEHRVGGIGRAAAQDQEQGERPHPLASQVGKELGAHGCLPLSSRSTLSVGDRLGKASVVPGELARAATLSDQAGATSGSGPSRLPPTVLRAGSAHGQDPWAPSWVHGPCFEGVFSPGPEPSHRFEFDLRASHISMGLPTPTAPGRSRPSPALACSSRGLRQFADLGYRTCRRPMGGPSLS